MGAGVPATLEDGGLLLREDGQQQVHLGGLLGGGYVGQGGLVELARGELAVEAQPGADHELIDGVAQIGQAQVAHFQQFLLVFRYVKVIHSRIPLSVG